MICSNALIQKLLTRYLYPLSNPASYYALPNRNRNTSSKGCASATTVLSLILTLAMLWK